MITKDTLSIDFKFRKVATGDAAYHSWAWSVVVDDDTVASGTDVYLPRAIEAAQNARVKAH